MTDRRRDGGRGGGRRGCDLALSPAHPRLLVVAVVLFFDVAGLVLCVWFAWF